MIDYYAHSPKDGIPAQSYTAHVGGVHKRVLEYLNALVPYAKHDGALLANVSEMAAIYHDLGKLDDENQLVLSGVKIQKRLPKNHVDAGVAHCTHNNDFVTASIVNGHHRGFPNIGLDDDGTENFLRDLKIKSKTDLVLSKLEEIHNNVIKSNSSFSKEKPKGDGSVFLRLVLSCLADADHTDTATHYQKYPEHLDTVQLRSKERLDRLNNYVTNLNDEKVKSEDHINAERNKLRSDMYVACRDSVIDTNISSCDSPVGSGKTFAVMAHLLAQATKRGLRRIFVVLPFTNIIEQSVKEYRKALVLSGEKPDDVVAELHHRADFQNKDARQLTALWRAPIIVTTAVAFFETLASNMPSTLRRLHELPGSAIFVDESHAALPVTLLPIAWRWMNIYASEWSCYWVLASGSLCRFWQIDEISKDNYQQSVPEIVNDELRGRLSIFENNRIIYKSDLKPKGVEELANWIIEFPGPRLVILNTVQSAAVIADYFSKHFNRERIEHLSTALTSTDREKTLNNVKKRLKDKNDTDWTLVATSCVEAGVDISFRTGFRELSSLVSLLQTSGRVDREGLYKNAEIWTFCLVDGDMLVSNPGMKNSADILKYYFEKNMEITPRLSTLSLEEEIRLSGKVNDTTLIDDERMCDFIDVKNKFKVIKSNTEIVVVDKALANSIRCDHIDWRMLQKNSVQIARHKLNPLYTSKIQEDVEIYEWNIEYNDFIGYMAGIIQYNGFVRGEPQIV
jgi:CRISPR-associated endonuclease/helicase Cas3